MISPADFKGPEKYFTSLFNPNFILLSREQHQQCCQYRKFKKSIFRMRHVYCISGLGADSRIFQQLKIEEAVLHFIQWEMPQQGATLQSFALQLTHQIQHNDIVLIGVSYGGMLASEINRMQQEGKLSFHIRKTIIISSCKSPHEMPAMLRVAGWLRLHKLVPYWLALRSNRFNRYFFDPRSKAEELYLKRLMLKGNALLFIRRSVHLILTWRTLQAPSNLVHIHGTSDMLLRPAQVQADYWIPDGGHFMVWNKAPEISAIINKLLP